MSPPPAKFGHYRATRLVRRGVHTELWQALKDGSSERFAVKIRAAGYRGSDDIAPLLKHEFAVAQKLKHRNLVGVLEFGMEREVPYLVMQLFKAPSLRQMLSEGQSEKLRSQFPRLAEQAADALHYLHENGWVHCDVKPAHLLVNEPFDLKLIDFSIARKSSKGMFDKLLSKQRVTRTPNYVSPEQIRGLALDARSDIYSLGCVLFELLTGRVPYTGTTAQELLNKHLTAPVPLVPSQSGQVSDGVAELIQRMMAKRPEDRLPSMAHVALELRRLFPEEGPPSGQQSPAFGLSLGEDGEEARKPERVLSAAASQSTVLEKVASSAAVPAVARKLRGQLARTLQRRSVRAALVILLIAGCAVWYGTRASRHAWIEQTLAQSTELVQTIERYQEESAAAEAWTALEEEAQSISYHSERNAERWLRSERAVNPLRPAVLELVWATKLLPAAVEHGKTRDRDDTSQANKLAIHLENAQKLVAQNAELVSREERIDWRKYLNSDAMLYVVIVVDLLGGVWLARLFFRRRAPAAA